MAGSKVHYLFCIDFCKLIGQDTQRPNQESWEAMTLQEQQAFVLQMINDFAGETVKRFDEVNKSLAEEVTAPTLAELGVQIAEDGTLEPLPGNEIVVNNGEVKVVAEGQLPIEEAPADPPVAEETPTVEPVAEVSAPAELPLEGDLGSIPPA